VPVCETECCGDCPVGHSRVPDATTCCGLCVPLSCTDNEGLKRAVGESWPAVEDKCVVCSCKQGKRDIYAECFSTRRVLTEAECPAEFVHTSEDGCVQECRAPVEEQQSVGGCAVTNDFVGRISVEINGMACETERDFEVNMCSGECVSSTVSKDGKMVKQCSCCAASKTVEKEVTVKCADGSVRSHKIELVEECSCGKTKCEAEEKVTEKPEVVVTPAPQKKEKDNLLEQVAKKVKKESKRFGNRLRNWFG